MEFNHFPIWAGLTIYLSFFLFNLIKYIKNIQRGAAKRKQLAEEKREKLKFLETYQFSPGLKSKFAKTREHLSSEQQEMVFNALKDYFLICYQADKKMVSMPSQIVDEAWHEFILFTQDYADFCSQFFDRFLHHTPAEAMAGPNQANSGIQLAWQLACAKENINFRQPKRLPLLFAIDDLLKIENGFYYSLNCSIKATNKKNTESTQTSYCVTDIGCTSSYSSDSSGHGCSSSHSSDSSGHSCGGHSCSSCGGGCSGGCGGGCGGG